jgi:hypothetical protein
MMGYTSGIQLCALSLKKVESHVSIAINKDLILDNRPEYGTNELHAYADSDWATCVKTCCSFGGTCVRLAGGTIAHKSKLQPMVPVLSTRAKFKAAHNTGKMILFFTVYFGTWIFLKRLQQFFMKIMMLVWQWGMRRNLQLVLNTLISNTFQFVNGLDVT